MDAFSSGGTHISALQTNEAQESQIKPMLCMPRTSMLFPPMFVSGSMCLVSVSSTLPMMMALIGKARYLKRSLCLAWMMEEAHRNTVEPVHDTEHGMAHAPHKPRRGRSLLMHHAGG